MLWAGGGAPWSIPTGKQVGGYLSHTEGSVLNFNFIRALELLIYSPPQRLGVLLSPPVRVRTTRPPNLASPPGHSGAWSPPCSVWRCVHCNCVCSSVQISHSSHSLGLRCGKATPHLLLCVLVCVVK